MPKSLAKAKVKKKSLTQLKTQNTQLHISLKKKLLVNM